MELRLVAYEPNGASLGVLPTPQSLSAAYLLGDVGGLTLTYGTKAPRADLLGQPVEIALETRAAPKALVWTTPQASSAVIAGRLEAEGWQVVRTTAKPTLAELTGGGYHLFAIDYNVWGIPADGLTLAYEAYQAGLNVLTSGNDTTWNAGNPIWTGATHQGTSSPSFGPVTPAADHLVAQGWSAFTDTDAKTGLTGVRASAVTVATWVTTATATVPNTTYAAVIAEQNPNGNGARYVHIEPASSYTPAALHQAVSTWLLPSWTEPPDSRFLYLRDRTDPIKRPAILDAECPAYLWRFSRAYVGVENLAGDGKRRFLSATPGTILKTLIQEAQARGALAGITHSTWSTSADSSGAAWDKIITIAYDPTLDLLAPILNLVAQGLIDVQMVGRDLRVYRADTTLATDRTTGQDPVILRAGRDLTEAPARRTWEGLTSAVLLVGDEGVNSTRTNPSALQPWGRWETTIAQGGVSDTGTMAVLSDAELERGEAVRTEFTNGLAFGDAVRLPFRDYQPGDYVYRDLGQGLERLRVRSVTLTQDAKRQVGGNVVLNDRFLEQDIRTARRVKGIQGGAAADGGSGARPVPVDAPDTGVPEAVAGVNATSTAYKDSQGNDQALVTVSWGAVTTNTDATAADDIDRYVVEWRIGSTGTVQVLGVTQGTTLSASPLPVGTAIQVRVYAMDRNGNVGAASAWFALTTANDTTPPGQPSTPTVSAYLGQLAITWNGLLAAGGGQPVDYEVTEVHVGTTTGFTPTTATLNGHLRGGGVWIATDLSYGQTYYVRLVSLDKNGNRSTPSAQASGVPERVSGLDVAALTIATSNLADSAVAAGKIADGAVLDTKIATDAVTSTKIASAAVVAAKIADAAVGTTKIATAAITSALIADLAVGTAKIADAAIASAKIADAAIVEAKIGTAAITNAKIADLAVGTAKIADAAIATAKIGDAAITTAKIGDAQVVNAKIANLAVDDAKIANLAVGKITAGKLVATYVELGGRLTTKVGGTQTGARVELDANGLRAYNASSTGPTSGQTVGIGADGTATFSGAVTATSGKIGQFIISGTALYSNAGGSNVQMDSDAVGGGFWAGAIARDSAPFRVTPTGALVASNANITGTITADSGKIGGFTIGLNSLVGTDANTTFMSAPSGGRVEIKSNLIQWYRPDGVYVGGLVADGGQTIIRTNGFDTESAELNVRSSAVVGRGPFGGTRSWETAPLIAESFSAQTANDGRVPRIAFHWPGANAPQIGADYTLSSRIRTYDQNGGDTSLVTAESIPLEGTLTKGQQSQRTVGQFIGAQTWSQIDLTDHNVSDGYGIVTRPSSLYFQVQRSGWYLLSGTAYFLDWGANTRCIIGIAQNADPATMFFRQEVRTYGAAGGRNDGQLECGGAIYLVSGQTVALFVWSEIDCTVTRNTAGFSRTSLSVIHLGRNW